MSSQEDLSKGITVQLSMQFTAFYELLHEINYAIKEISNNVQFSSYPL